jgi:glutathione synthase/RimK-type ligase-like ATP-grasp enzyme
VGGRLVVVASPGDKRLLALTRAMERVPGATLAVVPWGDALRDPALVGRHAQPGDRLRIESPGACEDTWHALARKGGFGGTVPWGQWRPGRAWFTGLSAALTDAEAAAPLLRPTHPADGILAMVDKWRCDARLRAAGVPVPDTWLAPSTATALRAQLEEQQRHAVYVKPRWGSSGAGVLAFRWTARAEQLTTTARCVDGRIVNEKRLRTVTDRATIDRLLDAVLSDGAVVQRWIPKAGVAGGPFDARVLVVNGRVGQHIARVGRGTITNLHLDASRMDLASALAAFGPGAIERVFEVCLRAAACFPGHSAVGVDVMVDPEGRAFVLECNAWGDYLPGLLVGGLDSYDLQVRDLFAQEAA